MRPNVISLPTGPGSISGLGEQFEPNLNTGSGSYAVKLAVPPGTAGLQPSLALAYDSGMGNGSLGIGWALEAGGIQRQTDKGLPRYDGADRFLYNGQELVPVGEGVYRLKQEGAFLRFRFAGGRWEVDAPSGAVYRFGISPAARVEGPEGTFRWALEAMVDVWGNRILFSYEKDGGQLYLTRIDYNARAGAADNSVRFEYETRADALTDFRAGFGVTTAWRLKRVRMLALGQQVRRYELTYEAASSLSRLASVTLYGADDVTTLPPVRFTYTDFAPGRQSVREVRNAPVFSLKNANTELVDFDGDSLPDLLSAEVGRHTVAYNEGERWSAPVAIVGSPSVQLSTNGVEVADVNGDGLADLVAKLGSATSDFYYFPNKGQGRWEGRVGFTSSPPFSFEDATVKPLDFDGDGLTDVMQTTSSQFYYWRNNGDGSWAAPLTGAPLPGEAVLFSDAGVRLADMNGDRLVDVVTVRPGNVGYWPNMGYGHWGPRVALRGSPDAGVDAFRVQLADVNGDGLADAWLASGTQLSLWLQRGDGSFADVLTVTGLPEANPATTVVRAADMDGSGTTDIVWNTPGGPTPWRYLDVLGGVRPGLLKAVENGLGRVMTLAYSSSGAMYQAARAHGASWATRLPVATQVVASITTRDSRGWQGVQQFDYRDGYYDGPTRQFRGFGRATRTEKGEENEATAVTLHEFDVGLIDEALKGSPRAMEVRTEEGLVLRREAFHHDVRLHATGTDGRRVARAERTFREVQHVEGTAAPVTTREEWTYDDWGNVLSHSEWGVVEGTNVLKANDERITHTEYTHDTDSWLLGRPVRQWVTNAKGERLSETRTYYDGEAFVGLPLGRLGRQGVATRTEAWVEGARFIPSERVQYDAYGLVVATLSPTGTRRDMEYDASTHRLVLSERIQSSPQHALVMEATYDEALGTVRQYRDFAGRVTRFRYDALQRVTSILRPGDVEDKPTLSFEYHHGSPLSEVVTRSRPERGGSDTVELHAWQDGLGRPAGMVATAESGQTLVSGVMVYGARGQVVREYEAFFSSGFSLPQLRSAYTAMTYDALGRNVASVLQDGTRVELRFLPLATESWDAEDLDPASAHRGTPTVVRMNGLGLESRVERLGEESIVTRFERDALGRVVREVDATGHAGEFSYDGLGRTVTSLHPAAGRRTFQYDDAGNLLVQVDARGSRVESRYDGLDRLVEERLVSSTGAEEERVRYHYDEAPPRFPDASFYEGQLGWVEDGAGEKHFRYDDRGRVIESWRTVGEKAYRFAHQYDNLDRSTRLTYPSAREVEFRYSARGLLDSVPGIVDALTYDASGLLLSSRYANGAAVTLGHDTLGHIASLRTSVSGRDVQSLSYDFDKAGNLLRIDDALRATGPLSATRRFTYDSLYRLVAANGAEQAWAYSFDNVGNFLTKSDVGTYEYEAPHRATRIGGRSYSYDAAGQLVSSPGAQNTYDAKGRLASVRREDGTEVRFRYDYAGVRIVREVAGPGKRQHTLYVEGLTEDRDGVLVDFVFANQQRVASLSGEYSRAQAALAGVQALPRALASLAILLFVLAAAACTSPLLRRRTRIVGALAMVCAMGSVGCGGCGTQENPTPGAVYFHFDHLGSVALQTDEGGNVLTDTAYEPYGRILTATSESYGYTGKEWDADAHLYNFGARAYDPAIGRFLTPDPAALASPEFGARDSQLLAVYAYARNLVTALLDPDGLAPMSPLELQARANYLQSTANLRERAAIEAGQQQLVREANWSQVYNQASWQEQTVFDLSELTGGNDMARGYTGASERGEQLSLWERVKAGASGLLTAANWATTATSLGKVVLAESASMKLSSAAMLRGGCFVAGTPVLTAEGEKAIEEVAVGEWVWAWDEVTKAPGWHRVTRTFIKPERVVLRLVLVAPDGRTEELGTTAEHPFWVLGKGWTHAQHLELGDVIETATGTSVRVHSLSLADRPETVYNLEVEEAHTYFVGTLAAWVHNTSTSGLVNVEKGGGRFASTDPHVADLANKIEARYPGHVLSVNRVVRDAGGRVVTDFDIELQNSVIQVKSKGKGLASQIDRTAAVTSKPVIGYGPELKPSVVREVQRRGGLVTTDEATLLDVVRP
ncbi:toxin TcdB middle/N-terminal domain-containing protein [Myxococcaceae bacterium GXIMD 01537]